ncbi:hypothetical protein TorRG33x02_224050 [Trema orientale]|uniref:Uncharacterized protein n=1 Tax=Trema orientale TaxID=63057 RepID=A0A2P5E8F4_TREOI|nr:hypothetical protein TorRG33x02_224050 [Trema orientale]
MRPAEEEVRGPKMSHCHPFVTSLGARSGFYIAFYICRIASGYVVFQSTRDFQFVQTSQPDANPTVLRGLHYLVLTKSKLGKLPKRHRSPMSFGLLRPRYFSTSTRA